MKRVVALLMLAVLASGALSACNTVKGFGQDLQKVGEKMEDAGDKDKK